MEYALSDTGGFYLSKYIRERKWDIIVTFYGLGFRWKMGVVSGRTVRERVRTEMTASRRTACQGVKTGRKTRHGEKRRNLINS